MMGIPMGLQYSITAIGSVVIQTAINSLGSIAVASVTAGQKIGMFFCCPFACTGRHDGNLWPDRMPGAGKTDRIRQGVRSATFIGSIYSVLACIVLTLFGGVIPLLFVDASETVVIHQAHQFLTFNSLFYIPLTIVNVWRFTIQGGLQSSCHSRRCLRDDRPGFGWICTGSHLRLHYHMLRFSSCVAYGRRLSDSGLLLLPAEPVESTGKLE